MGSYLAVTLYWNIGPPALSLGCKSYKHNHKHLSQDSDSLQCQWYLLLLPNNDLLQQFEDYVIELRCEKGRKKKKNTIRKKFKNMYKAASEYKDEMW